MGGGRMIEYIEHYKSSQGIRIYYVGQKIGNRTVARIENCYDMYSDRDSLTAILFDENGERIRQIWGGKVTEKHNRERLPQALEGEKEYIKDTQMLGGHIKFGTGNVTGAFTKKERNPEGWNKFKERMCIG